MPSNTVNDLELALVNKGYSITKKYDGAKGICFVTVERKISGTVITDHNRSNAPLWNAYRRALELILEQVNLFEKTYGKNP